MADASVEKAAQSLQDCSRVLVFDEQGKVLYASFPASAGELPALSRTLQDRDSAIKSGMTVQETRYEVHRFHPPLAYGRTMDGPPESSEGCALYAASKGPTGCPAYAVITYRMPNVSARMVSQLQTWCKQHLER